MGNVLAVIFLRKYRAECDTCMKSTKKKEQDAEDLMDFGDCQQHGKQHDVLHRCLNT